MKDPQKEARDLAAKHGIKAYEPPTAKQEPCECRVRKALESIALWLETERGDTNWPQYEKEAASARAALSDPCSCEQLGEEPCACCNGAGTFAITDGMIELWCSLCHGSKTRNAGENALWLRKDRQSLHAECDQLRGQNEGLRAAVRNQARTISELQAECEQLRKRAAELEMARDVARDSAALWTKNAFTAVGELHAARSLLEEARLALRPHVAVGRAGRGRVACSDYDRAAAVLAKIEASRTPEVKP